MPKKSKKPKRLDTGKQMLAHLKRRFRSGKTDEEICYELVVAVAAKPVLIAAVREAVKQ